MNFFKTKFLMMIASSMMVFFMTGCGGSGGSDNPPPKPPPVVTLDSISISPANLTLLIGVEGIQYEATGNYSDGSTKDLTSEVMWSSSNTDVMTVDNAGKVTSIAEGTATISAEKDGLVGSTGVRVANEPVTSLASIQLTLANDGTSATVPAGTRGSLIATAVMTDGRSFDATQWVTFTSNQPEIVNVKKSGIAMAVKPGNAQLTASYNTITSNSVSVTVTKATLVKINLSPAQETIFSKETLQFEAQGIFSDGRDYPVTNIATWSSSDPSIAMMREKPKGLAVANGEGKTGTTIITASVGDVASQAQLTVVNPKLTSIKIVRDDSTVVTSNEEFVVGTTRKVKALGTFDNGVTNKDITAYVKWTVGSEGTVTVDQTGLITAVKAGNASVTASRDSISDTITGIVVDQAIKEILVYSDDTDNSVPVNNTIQLTAYAVFNDGYSQDITNDAKWTSDTKGVTVLAGNVKGTVATKANITVEFKGASKTVAVEFTEKKPSHFEIQEVYCEKGDCPIITGKTVSIPIVDDVSYDPRSPGSYYPTAWLVYDDGSKVYVNQNVNWWSADQVRAYVNTIKGSYVFGRGEGSGIEIRASYHKDGIDMQASFYVDVKPKVTLSITELGILNTSINGWGCEQNKDNIGKTLTMKVGDRDKNLQACAIIHCEGGGDCPYPENEWVDVNNNVAWLSDDRNIAFVRNVTGNVVASGKGNTTIRVQLLGKEGSIGVTVVGK